MVDSQRETSEHELSKRVDSSDLAYYMYLKGQVLERLGWDKDKILELQVEAIALEESLGAPKSENLA